MGRIRGVWWICLLFTIFVLYCIYESSVITGISSYNEFLVAYLNNVQKYLYIVTLFTVLLLYQLKIPFLKPEFRIRYGNNIVYLLIERGLIFSMLVTLFIYFLFTGFPLLFGYEVSFTDLQIVDIVRLVSFIYYLFLLYLILYVHTSNLVAGLLGVLLLNFLILIIFISINFYILSEQMNRVISLQYLMNATLIFNVLGSIYLVYLLKYKEILR